MTVKYADKRCLQSKRPAGECTVPGQGLLCVSKYALLENESRRGWKKEKGKRKHDKAEPGRAWRWFLLKNSPGDETKLTLLPVVKENIETGYNITENNQQNGSYTAIYVKGQDEPKELGCVEHKCKYSEALI